MPLMPNVVERMLFYTLNQGPGVTMDLWGGPSFYIVVAALQLKLFDQLTNAKQSAASLAQALQADERGIQILLDALEDLHYVDRKNNRYSLTSMTRKWLTDDGDINFSSFFLYWAAIMDVFMPKLAQTIRTGEPETHLYEWIENQPEVSRNFQDGMIAIARYVADDIARAMPVPEGTARVLDVGGGHGQYAIALCHRHPQLSATILDSPQALVSGHAAVQQAGLNDQITFVEGDILKDDLGSNYDIALVFNIVHGFRDDGNLAMFNRIRQALKTGGVIAVLEQTPDSTPLPLGKAVTRILSMAYYHLIAGQMYDYDAIASWLRAAKFDDIQRKKIPKGSSSLITARKSG